MGSGTPSKQYDPGPVEERWREYWNQLDLFHAGQDLSKPPFCIVIPPPNVTGSLHIGHALNNTLQDILVRWKRMDGYDALWMPGTDHAGIATQNVIERQLHSEGLSRESLGREQFVVRIWKWKQEVGGTIIRQLKRLGASCDWKRERFTMDEGLSRAVLEVFVRLHEDGLLYRAERQVNWCPRCETALSDIEVVHEEREGKLWHILYPFADDSAGGLIVATTRPETMLADTAVAVNPEDERYVGAVGKTVILPLVGRRIPVIADSYVSREFGTGALKVTPGHDPNDYEIGRRHGLPIINALDSKGNLSQKFLVDDAGKPLDSPAARYVGLDRYEARRQIVEDLREEGLLVKEEAYRHAVGHCYRCQTPIEPFLTPQWFVRMSPLAGPAIQVVEEGQVQIIPETWKNTYFEWMRNIRDWCISRQIWWGHRIPAWYCLSCNKDRLVRTYSAATSEGRGSEHITFLPDAVPIVARQAPQTCPRCGSSQIEQDPDVLDTWFSSALWPFSTLGWPEPTADLKRYYPTDVLVTSFDILFFWVARMIMMGLKFMGDIPFRQVYIHALVRDAEGQKMSKSRGNVIDPLEVMERTGTDAFRFTLAAFAAQGRDILLSEERIEGYRHFCNKLWNASRFTLMNLDGEAAAGAPPSREEMDLAERWILSRLSAVVENTRQSLDSYKFNEAAGQLYQFVWHEFCDWYLEMAKPRLAQSSPERQTSRQILQEVLDAALRLLHPFMPFITEEIWSHMPGSRQSIATAPYPKASEWVRDPEAESKMNLIMEAVGGVRTIRGEIGMPTGKRVSALIRAKDPEAVQILEAHQRSIALLAGLEKLETGVSVQRPRGAATAVLPDMEVYVPLLGLIDFQEEKQRLEKEIRKVQADLEFIARKLANPNFPDRAPADIVQKEKEAQQALLDKRGRLEQALHRVMENLED
ncbi:MAG: valine--tRNA ligase [Candidatus Tectomicrobia bacterium]|uniref:Valine--tRNA ligase n=1 Tax=Tectimicrobiota bacterium TaxID=2528274 RepID=A0A932LZ08_UNCTE|nr:valine--tRNA ligase [Candidatus Tectomicrobia bacterium]